MRDMVAETRVGKARNRTGATEALRIMDALRRIVRELHVAAHSSETDLGVSAAQLFVLRQLLLQPGQSLSHLAERTRTSPSTISEVVARLVARDLVSRRASTTDRRRVELSLTAGGRAVATRATLTIQERLLAGLEQLGDQQRATLAAGMDAWMSAAGLAAVPPTMFFER